MKTITLSLLLLILLTSLEAAETRYSRAVKAYNDVIIKPIKPKIPAMIEKLKVYKKNTAKLNATQKRDMENIILTLKRYNFINKLNTIFERCHENLSLIPDAKGEKLDDTTVDFTDPTLRQARIELNAAGKSIRALFQEYPVVSKEPEIAKIMRSAFSEPKQQKKKKRRNR